MNSSACLAAAAVVALGITAGCAGTGGSSSSGQHSAPLTVEPELTSPIHDESLPAPPPRSESNREQPVVAVNLPPPAAVVPAVAAPVPPVAHVAKPVAPAAKPHALVSAPPVAIALPAKVTAPVAVKPPEPPPLNVAALKTGLRNTPAIGVFTKLALQNQMDDLLKQFRAHYQGGQSGGVTFLRPPFDALVVKVLALLQEGDPTLARTISTSREAIWGVLSDPEKFASAT